MHRASRPLHPPTNALTLLTVRCVTRHPPSPPVTPSPRHHQKAKDALATIDGRLKGTLLGVASVPTAAPLSVEGQVARLVAEAVDHENLGRMYIWWMPWF